MQDMAPLMLGAKPPILLALGCFAGIPTAIVAGLFADALGAMPFGCSAAFFAVAAITVRFALHGWAAKVAGTVAAVVAYQLWISLWGGGEVPSLAFVGALLVATAVVPAMYVAVRLARRWIGIDFDRRQPA